MAALLGDRFELADWIGEGSLSVVHAARDRVTGREVAVKLANDSDRDRDSVRRRFDREAAALSVIASDHVVELISAGSTDDGRPYLVLERLDGRDLQEILDEIGPLKPARVARFVRQAASALELAHGLGIVHRDLKPANLFVHATPDRRAIVKVLDFGMVVDVGGPTHRARDAFGGTPLYMAPEQVRGQLSRIGPATDVWGLAMVTVTLLTGDRYWNAGNSDDVMREVESSPIEAPSARWRWLPEAFDDWFARSTQRVPERRYHGVAEQAAALEQALAGVQAPDRRVEREVAEVANTVAGYTPTPSVVLLSGRGAIVVGRQIECAEVERQLAAGQVVTLTGTAGIGKTRLAEIVAETIGDSYADGAWLVALGGRSGSDPLVSSIADVLELEPDNTRSLFEHVAASLRGRELLLILDGVEQISGGAETIERLRRACPSVSWLCTSRLPLALPDERVIGVDPLELPPPGPISSGEAATFSAVELFVRRARQVTPSFVLSDDNTDAVIGICRAVEGFPLGIELAAVQMAAASPAEVRDALDDVGKGDERGGVRAAVAWSYGLLDDGEQALLRHLALLPAGLTFEQVKQLLGHLTEDPVVAVLHLVKSNLASWSNSDPRRLVMLDTVREMCHDLSWDLREERTLWRVACRHAEQVASWDDRDDPGQEAWLSLVDQEHDNLRTVLGYLLANAPDAAVRLAGQLAWYWYLRGHYSEGAGWLEAALAASEQPEIEDRIRALHGAGRLALLSCRYERASELLERARRLAHETGDLRGEASAVTLLGSVARERGDYAGARARHQRGLALSEQLGDEREAARARNYLAFAAWLGDPAGDPRGEEEPWWRGQAETEMRRLGDPEGIVWALLNQGAIAHYAGDRDAARLLLGRAFAESIAARFHEGIAWSLNLIGLASLERRELVQARAQLAASLRVHRRLGDLWRCASVLEALAAVAVTAGRPARGAVYLGAADAVRASIETPVPAAERALVDRTEARGVAELGDAFAAGRERGRRTPLDQIVELAREVA